MEKGKAVEEEIGSILARIVKNACAATSGEDSGEAVEKSPDRDFGCYDFDLAEFPIFRFGKHQLAKHSREPIVYSDTIRGQDGQESRSSSDRRDPPRQTFPRNGSGVA